jgi:hypothetical protein
VETGEYRWPTDKLTALQLGRRLVAEVAASGRGRRAFVDVTPTRIADDTHAQQQGWTRSDTARGFQVEQWEYDANRIDGFDYDVDAVLVRAAFAADASELIGVLTA